MVKIRGDEVGPIAARLYKRRPPSTSNSSPSQLYRLPLKYEAQNSSGLSSSSSSCYLQELANLTCESSLEKEESNREKVRALYDALSGGDAEAVQQLLAPDIEWWFHGPPACQYMMRMLTGQQQSDESFQFEPSSITAIDYRTVVAEGRNANVFWVHAWTITDGVITQVREYFNTSLTVTRFAASSSSSKPSTHCLPLWQSRLPRGTAKSMPALVLAI